MVFIYVKKVCSAGFFLGQNILYNAVLSKEKLKETGARLEHSPCKSLTQFAQQAQISTTRAWSMNKKLHLLLYKIRQVQVTADGNCKRRTHFCKWFLQTVYNGFLDPELIFFYC
jgi:hypothetical protein